MATMQINGTELEVQTDGEGPPVVFLHGAYSDYRSVESQVEALSSDYRCINYSRRYYYPNDPMEGEQPNPIGPHVDDLEALLDELSVDQAHLIGLSHGGLIALHFARNHPDRVAKLVAGEPAALALVIPWDPGVPDLLKLLVTHPLVTGNYMKLGQIGMMPALEEYEAGNYEQGGEKFMVASVGKDYFERFSEERLEQIRQNAKPHGRLFADGGPEPFTAEDCQQIEAPALILHGEDSSRFMKFVSQRVAQLLPDARRREVPDASHLMNEDNPSAFNQYVREFL